MVCDPDETDLDIQIPSVMLPHDAGVTLEKMLMNSSSGKFLLNDYKETRFIFDILFVRS